MTNLTSPSQAKSAVKELVLTRVFNAPRGLVFKAWIDPKHLAQWWGPRGFTNPVCELDVRPGGGIRVDMTGPDGTAYPMKGEFHEIVEPERLVFTTTAFEDAQGNPKLEVHNTVTFTEQDGKTKITLRAIVLKAGPEVAAAIAGMDEGWSQSLDRLSEELEKAPTTTDRELAITRLFDAPRELVFKAWTDPAHIAQWWGPTGFTTTTHAMDVRSGGVWRFIMHGPDGRDYPNRITYEEVVKPERIVYRHNGGDDIKPVQFQVNVMFAEEGSKTRLTMRMTFSSAEDRAHVVKVYKADEGLKETIGRLGEFVARIATSQQEFTVTRDFDAPRDLVFRAWTESEHLTRWFGPVGFTTLSSKNDLRPGGLFHYCMRSGDGREMWGKWVYREIVRPERLVFVNSFSDAEGNTVRAPFSADWPLEVLSTVTFEEHNGRTTVTLRGIPVNASEVERKTFENGRSSMQQGWKGTLDQLTEYLAKI